MSHKKSPGRWGAVCVSMVVAAVIMVVPRSAGVMEAGRQADASGLWLYEIGEGGATLTGYAEEPFGELTIPSELDGHAVTGIGSNALSGCKRLTSVTVLNGVTEIGEWAFGDCEALASVTIPASVIDIGFEAFLGCEEAVFRVEAGSAAEQYATDHGISYIYIGEAPRLRD